MNHLKQKLIILQYDHRNKLSQFIHSRYGRLIDQFRSPIMQSSEIRNKIDMDLKITYRFNKIIDNLRGINK